MVNLNDIRWVLASGSPRRRELLGQIGVVPEIRPSHVEEKVSSDVPEEVVMELSGQKAEDVAAELLGQKEENVAAELLGQKKEDMAVELLGQKQEYVAVEEGIRQGSDKILVLGADTVVAVDGMILGKPSSYEEAYEMIKRIQGRTHQVYTGVTMICLNRDKKRGDKSKGVTFAEKTDVTVFAMTEEEIHSYVESGDSLDKAGAYGIQGAFAKYVAGIQGDYNNVVGLPVGRVYQEWKTLMEEEEQND